jgi:hypothetical protein
MPLILIQMPRALRPASLLLLALPAASPYRAPLLRRRPPAFPSTAAGPSRSPPPRHAGTQAKEEHQQEDPARAIG